MRVTILLCYYHRSPVQVAVTTIYHWLPKVLFSPRVVRIWNNMTTDVNFTSVKSFVRAIIRINFTIYCDFNVWSDSVLL